MNLTGVKIKLHMSLIFGILLHFFMFIFDIILFILISFYVFFSFFFFSSSSSSSSFLLLFFFLAFLLFPLINLLFMPRRKAIEVICIDRVWKSNGPLAIEKKQQVVVDSLVAVFQQVGSLIRIFDYVTYSHFHLLFIHAIDRLKKPKVSALQNRNPQRLRR